MNGTASRVRPWHLVLLLAAAFVSYANSFGVPFQFDDAPHIAENPLIRRFDLLFGGTDDCDQVATDPELSLVCRSLPTRITGYLTFALNYRVHGPAVSGYHAVNVAIHAANAVLLYIIVTLLVSRMRRRELAPHADPAVIALVASLLFTVHPVQTQAVTYIVQRFTLLAALFSLLSTACYLKWMAARDQPAGEGAEDRSRAGRRKAAGWYLGALAASVLAMKTKQTAFTLPCILLVMDVLFFDGRPNRRLLRIAPFLLTMAIVPLDLMGEVGSLGDLLSELDRTSRESAMLPRDAYLFTQFRVILTYLRLLVLPLHQNLDYDYRISRSLLEPDAVLSLLFILVLIGAATAAAVRSRREDVPVRLIAFGVFWFFAGLAVESSVIPIADVIFEHRLYYPSMGVIVSAVTAVVLGVSRLSRSKPGVLRTAAGLAAVLVLAFGTATWLRNGVWKSEVLLWSDVVSKSPEKYRAHINLADAFRKEKDLRRAIGHFDRAVALDPGRAHGYLWRAMVSRDLGDRDAARADLDRAIARDPADARAYSSRGLVLSELGRGDEALKDFDRALRLDPRLASVFNNRGVHFLREGRLDEAYQDFLSALAIDPYEAGHHANKASVLFEKGDMTAAIEAYSSAIDIDPRLMSVRYNRGLALRKIGRMSEALADFSAVIAAEPGSAAAYFQRARTLLATGRIEEAAADLRRSCELGSREACSFPLPHGVGRAGAP